MTYEPPPLYDCPDHGPCRYWCPVHLDHHVVYSLVASCVERATDPDERPNLQSSA